MKLTPNFSAKTTAKRLMREGRTGALATLMPGSGDPFCSLVNVATAADGSPVILISGLAVHTKNILADARVSLMLEERKEGDPLEGGRIMLSGTAAVTDDQNIRRRYLVRQPGAEEFFKFHDFAFYKIALKSAHLVAGFGRIVTLKPEDVLVKVDDADEMMGAEEELLAHMNGEHADTCNLYATKLLGAKAGAWKCVGIDPEGLELQLDRTALRLDFPKRVRFTGPLRKTLKLLADKARAA